MSVKDVLDFIITANGATVALFLLLTAFISHQRGVWMWTGDCKAQLASRDAEIARLRGETAQMQRRADDEKDELLALLINGASQTAALRTIVAARIEPPK